MNYDEKRSLAKDLAEMVRNGYLVAYTDNEGILRFVSMVRARPEHLRAQVAWDKTYDLIMSGECE